MLIKVFPVRQLYQNLSQIDNIRPDGFRGYSIWLLWLRLIYVLPDLH